MLLEGPTADELAKYVEDQLIPIAQAEPKPLAKYVMALLKKDRSLSSLESLCQRQLQEFLGDATSTFVRNLFAKLRAMQPAGLDSTRRRSNQDVVELPLKRGQSQGRDDAGDVRRRRHGSSERPSGREDPTGDDRDGRVGRGSRGYGRDGYGRDQRGGRGAPNVGPPGMYGPPDGHYFGQGPPLHDPNFGRGMVVDGRRGGPGPGMGPSGPHSHGPSPSRGSIPPQEDHRKTSTTLHITNVPPELNTIIHLVEHFKQFGAVVNIQVRQDQNRAFVQFSNRMEAQKAIRSPEAVLGNRFIKVYWSKADGSAPIGAPARGYVLPDQRQGSAQEDSESAPIQPIQPIQPPPAPRSTPNRDRGPLPDRSQLSFERNPSPSITLSAEEVAQAKAAQAKKAELQKELKEKLISQQKDIMTLLTAKKDSLDEATKKTLKQSLASINEQLGKLLHSGSAQSPAPSPAASSAPSTPSADGDSAARLAALREKLAAVQQAAQAQGVDTSFTGSFPVRGRGRGRGRGGFSARGSSARGRGRGGASTFGPRKLDNRPTSIEIGGLPEEMLDIEKLVAELPVLTPATLAIEDDSVIAHFSNRTQAEQVMNAGLELPTGALELSWRRRSQDETSDPSIAVYKTADDGAERGETESPPEAETYAASNDQLDDLDDEEEEEQDRSWKR